MPSLLDAIAEAAPHVAWRMRATRCYGLFVPWLAARPVQNAQDRHNIRADLIVDDVGISGYDFSSSGGGIFILWNPASIIA